LSIKKLQLKETKMNATEKTYVELGRTLITLCEKNEIFNGQDEESLTMWNAAVTAGNKMCTYGTTWSKFKSTEDLSEIEKKAVLQYLNQKV
jgi:frataxin-like iron-binding protein CyaY